MVLGVVLCRLPVLRESPCFLRSWSCTGHYIQLVYREQSPDNPVCINLGKTKKVFESEGVFFSITCAPSLPSVHAALSQLCSLIDDS